ncbi:MAG TPA: hypothetical protein VF458_23445 [Ktedonobacteraceae bacterium]
MFYPASAPVPEMLKTEEFLIRPLRATDVELDYDAVMSSRVELLLHSGGSWPREDFSLEENLEDLVMHEREHIERVAFTYTIMNPKKTECLGCIYLNPAERLLKRAGATSEQISEAGDYEAWTTFWVRHSRVADKLDARVLNALLTWFSTAWAFKRVLFAARKEQAHHHQLFTEAGLRLLFEFPRSLVYTQLAKKPG